MAIADHLPSRPVDRSKAEADLGMHIKKACSPEETSPKQKHVRKCIVYTWDYHTSIAFWTGLRTQPVLGEEVQTFKALIVVHKVLQEGHPVVLQEAQQHAAWLETAARMSESSAPGSNNYVPLIHAYVKEILSKLKFHRQHREFNGLFEYEEYIALKLIDNPDEGYETITDLMNMQDRIDAFQKLVFAHFRGGGNNNEARIAALVPQVKESYGIYKFLTSMLRAIARRVDGSDAIEPLRQRYVHQHHNLRRFYYECANLKYLTSLIAVPKLNRDPPSLTDTDSAPDLPSRPRESTPDLPPRNDTPSGPTQAEIDEQARLLKHYEDKQKRLKDQEAAARRHQAELQAQQERDFEAEQARQAEQQRQAQEALRQQQMAAAQSGRQAELERDLLAMRGQWERDQLMLEQYDRRVKSLEEEMAAVGNNVQLQLGAKDDLIRQLQEQVQLWRSKYEALAKLYSQLRSEHLDMLLKHKQYQLKAGSAQEALDKMERMEKDVRAKNLELADMIRERDRARFELDKIRHTQKEEFDRLKRDLQFANERAEDASRARSSEMGSVMDTLNRQITELEEALQRKQSEADAHAVKVREVQDQLQSLAEDKDAEIAILQEGMDSTIQQLNSLHVSQGANDDAVNAQIDTVILDNTKKLNSIIDSILQACADKVDDALYELESPSAHGNNTATPEYVLSMIEKGVENVVEFSSTFSLFLDGKQGGEHVEVIKKANQFAQTAADVLLSTKGIVRLAQSDEASDRIVLTGRTAGTTVIRFFENLQSFRPAAQRQSGLPNQTMQTRSALTDLSSLVESMLKSQGDKKLLNANDIGDVVENEMLNAANAIEAATQKLQSLIGRPKDNKFSQADLAVHDAILAASLAITRAIAGLIQAATESQQEIVAMGRGTSTNQQFYKKNNRWTEGLISAARAVAFATTMLIEAADGVISGTHSLEQLVVASNEVSAATAQLVAASRVKAELMSKTQDRLERAAKAVTEACKALVRQVKTITEKQGQLEAETDYSTMATHEFKVKEMEQQVEVLKLEKELTQARRKLGAMRRAGYHAFEDDD